MATSGSASPSGSESTSSRPPSVGAPGQAHPAAVAEFRQALAQAYPRHVGSVATTDERVFQEYQFSVAGNRLAMAVARQTGATVPQLHARLAMHLFLLRDRLQARPQLQDRLIEAALQAGQGPAARDEGAGPSQGAAAAQGGLSGPLVSQLTHTVLGQFTDRLGAGGDWPRDAYLTVMAAAFGRPVDLYRQYDDAIVRSRRFDIPAGFEHPDRPAPAISIVEQRTEHGVAYYGLNHPHDAQLRTEERETVPGHTTRIEVLEGENLEMVDPGAGNRTMLAAAAIPVQRLLTVQLADPVGWMAERMSHTIGDNRWDMAQSREIQEALLGSLPVDIKPDIARRILEVLRQRALSGGVSTDPPNDLIAEFFSQMRGATIVIFDGPPDQQPGHSIRPLVAERRRCEPPAGDPDVIYLLGYPDRYNLLEPVDPNDPAGEPVGAAMLGREFPAMRPDLVPQSTLAGGLGGQPMVPPPGPANGQGNIAPQVPALADPVVQPAPDAGAGVLQVAAQPVSQGRFMTEDGLAFEEFSIDCPGDRLLVSIAHLLPDADISRLRDEIAAHVDARRQGFLRTNQDFQRVLRGGAREQLTVRRGESRPAPDSPAGRLRDRISDAVTRASGQALPNYIATLRQGGDWTAEGSGVSPALVALAGALQRPVEVYASTRRGDPNLQRIADFRPHQPDQQAGALPTLFLRLDRRAYTALHVPAGHPGRPGTLAPGEFDVIEDAAGRTDVFQAAANAPGPSALVRTADQLRDNAIEYLTANQEELPRHPRFRGLIFWGQPAEQVPATMDCLLDSYDQHVRSDDIPYADLPDVSRYLLAERLHRPITVIPGDRLQNLAAVAGANIVAEPNPLNRIYLAERDGRYSALTLLGRAQIPRPEVVALPDQPSPSEDSSDVSTSSSGAAFGTRDQPSPPSSSSSDMSILFPINLVWTGLAEMEHRDPALVPPQALLGRSRSEQPTPSNGQRPALAHALPIGSSSGEEEEEASASGRVRPFDRFAGGGSGSGGQQGG